MHFVALGAHLNPIDKRSHNLSTATIQNTHGGHIEGWGPGHILDVFNQKHQLCFPQSSQLRKEMHRFLLDGVFQVGITRHHGSCRY